MAEAKRSRGREGVGPKAGPQLPDRVQALEQKVEALERELAALRPAARRAPEPARPAPRGPRCPGCSLPVEAIAKGTCPWCGFVFAAAARRARR